MKSDFRYEVMVCGSCATRNKQNPCFPSKTDKLDQYRLESQ